MGPADELPGILLVALGAPDTLAEVPSFLSAVRGGRPTPPAMVDEFVERYREIGGGSPLNRIGRTLARRLEARMELGGRPVVCRYGTLHGASSLTQGWDELLGAGATRIVCLPWTPFYTPWGVGRYLARVRELRRRRADRRPVVYLTGWHSAPGLARAWARRIGAASDSLADRYGERPTLLFSAHSLPDRPVDPPQQYTDQLDGLRAGILKELPAHHSEMAYQSVGRADGPWLGPAVEAVADRCLRATTAPVLLAPIGFLADNLEILYDLDRALRRRLGVRSERLYRVPSFNADDDLVATLEAIVGPAIPNGPSGMEASVSSGAARRGAVGGIARR
ncbi:MAG: ferrochelatase [Thermoplasmata archaeon]|jgi:ferrochelatase